jgi:hypothetical protein
LNTSGLISSSYTNAYALYVGTKILGLNTTTIDSQPIFPIPQSNAATSSEWLFFTEEASLRLALLGRLHGNYLPIKFPLHLLDDKWAFAEWLDSEDGLVKGLQQWSLAERDKVNFPVLLKARHSWIERVKLPRGWICGCSKELETNLSVLIKEGNDPKHFFLQEWLGNKQCRVVSVCGFHDSQNTRRNLVAIVERTASHTKGLSCSAAVQSIDDEWLLIDSTAKILNKLDFTGPYEMEYLVVNGRTLVLELNPRFWMQHAIFLKNGNGLIKRYLGQDTNKDHLVSKISNVIWIDGLYLISSILHLRVYFTLFVVAQLFNRNQEIIIWPNISMAFRVIFRIAFKKLQCKFFAR